MIKTIIFDFDGTIADTITTIADILNSLSTKYGYKRQTVQESEQMRDYTIAEIFKKLQVPLYKLPFMAHDTKKALNGHIARLQPIKGIKNVLQELKKKGYKLAIITSNNKKNVQVFLKKNDINFFDDIYTGTTIFGKARVIQGFLKKHNISLQEVIYVGDEIRDVEASKAVGIPIIAVTWGLNSKKGLERVKPDFLINEPKEILKILTSLV